MFADHTLLRHLCLIQRHAFSARPSTSFLRYRRRIHQRSVMSDPTCTNKSNLTTAQEERRWNRMSIQMQNFHNHFKLEFNALYEMADGSFNKRGLSLGLYLRQAEQLQRQLTLHHTIEERHIFPILAKRMPSFRNDEAHIKSHHGIHEGLDKLAQLLHKWKVEPSAYSPQEMRESLDSWREVLFKHLDEEVNDLSGENMKKYWTLEEMDILPM
ncbi:hypothetical protein QCA50_004376 [Cerrena zonata]|uniref:Hemerythrin-like domain-containing protein n=1 Tax=Cerrena zonata TaxID=2478898 RepID=A0AAW0GGN3_9APHY